MDEDDIPTLIESKDSTSRSGDLSENSSGATVPLTIVTGFLGAGKSTLIKRILTERHGFRIAVIMNEFGDTADIEAKTINVSSPDDPTAGTSEEILELANGCLCCSIKDSGAAAIEKLMQRKGAFDHILLETTGLADPGPIASMFWQNEEFAMGLGRDIHLDGVVCVVDAVFGKKQIEEDHAVDGVGESLRQIACADVILLNKVDLVGEDEVEDLPNLIGHVNPAAALHRTVKGQIDLKHIMGIDAYGPERLLREHLPGYPLPDPHDDCDAGCQSDEHAHPVGPHHYEMRGITSLQIGCPPLSTERFQKLDEWIRTVLWENHLPGEDVETIERAQTNSPVGKPESGVDLDRGHDPNRETAQLEVLRCKGIFRSTAGETYVLQGVRSLYEMAKVDGDSDASRAGLPDEGKLVLIGKGLNRKVRQSLENVVGYRSV